MSVAIVLFDLGNVVVDWRPARLYEKRFGDAVKARWFCDTICTQEWHKQHDRGVSMNETIPRLAAQHPIYAEDIAAWRDDWLETFEGYVPGVPELMGRLEARRVPLYGLSNISAEVVEQTFDAFPMIKILRDVVVSGAEGLIKPDPAIYRVALRRMGGPDPSNVLFIDDRPENTEAAAALGFAVHRFQDAVGLDACLCEHGLL